MPGRNRASVGATAGTRYRASVGATATSSGPRVRALVGANSGPRVWAHCQKQGFHGCHSRIGPAMEIL